MVKITILTPEEIAKIGLNPDILTAPLAFVILKGRFDVSSRWPVTRQPAYVALGLDFDTGAAVLIMSDPEEMNTLVGGSNRPPTAAALGGRVD